jgi:hypothetical protein
MEPLRRNRSDLFANNSSSNDRSPYVAPAAPGAAIRHVWPIPAGRGRGILMQSRFYFRSPPLAPGPGAVQRSSSEPGGPGQKNNFAHRKASDWTTTDSVPRLVRHHASAM